MARLRRGSPAPPGDGEGVNRMLASLPASEYRRLQALLMRVPLRHRQVLHAAGERVRSVYFPVHGLCSVVTAMEDGRMVEVASIGREGMTGLHAVFSNRSPTTVEVVAQLSGAYADAMNAETFAAEMRRRGPFSEIVSRYTGRLLAIVMQSAACNALHAADQRCARWLLHTRDRVGQDEFFFVQEQLAAILGLRRATITAAVRDFQRTGLVALGRRQIAILSPKGLERTACECYRVVKAQLDKTDRIR